MNRDALAALADPSKDQYFLTATDKLQILIQAADIRPSDAVVEIGAGAGTVARSLPNSASLTLIELDEHLIDSLKQNVPGATVLNVDGFELLRSGALTCDVLLSNLPNTVTPSLVALLPRMKFRTAVLAMGSTEPLDALSDQLSYAVLAVIEGDDFTPPQPSRSILVRVVRRAAEAL